MRFLPKFIMVVILISILSGTIYFYMVMDSMTTDPYSRVNLKLVADEEFNFEFKFQISENNNSYSKLFDGLSGDFLLSIEYINGSAFLVGSGSGRLSYTISTYISEHFEWNSIDDIIGGILIDFISENQSVMINFVIGGSLSSTEIRDLVLTTELIDGFFEYDPYVTGGEM